MKRQERYSVGFTVSVMWQERSGGTRRVIGRCMDLSSEGIQIETRDRLDPGTAVLVSSDEFGRMGHATVRHCRRDGMKCLIGLRFGAAFGLGDPARQKILERILRAPLSHAAATKPTDATA